MLGIKLRTLPLLGWCSSAELRPNPCMKLVQRLQFINRTSMAEGWGGESPVETGRRGFRADRCWMQSARPIGVQFTLRCSHSWDKSVDCSIPMHALQNVCTDDKFWQLHNLGVVVLEYYFQNSLSICSGTYCRLLQTIFLATIYVLLAFSNHNPVTRIYPQELLGPIKWWTGHSKS